MRYAMRLSVVDPVTAEKEFREASEGLNVIKAQDEILLYQKIMAGII